MREYVPDGWAAIKLEDDNGTFFRIFGSWSGGYATGDYWKLNSNVERVEYDDTHYYFYGYSGSVYKCAKGGGHISVYNSAVLYRGLESMNATVVDLDYVLAEMEANGVEVTELIEEE